MMFKRKFAVSIDIKIEDAKKKLLDAETHIVQAQHTLRETESRAQAFRDLIDRLDAHAKLEAQLEQPT